MTFQIMRQSYLDFEAVRTHARPMTGFAYFIGLPSLHAAIALLFQLALRRSSVNFWLFLPINCLMAVSTVVLGYHYVLDTIAGLLLTPLVLGLLRIRAIRGRYKLIQPSSASV